jgi:hypothetical protein
MLKSIGASGNIGESIRVAWSRGVSALERLQSSDGSFPLERSTSADNWIREHPLFSTATVLLCVGSMLNARTRETALNYIVSQRRESGLWGFDARSELPADADDSACALACLLLWRPSALESTTARELLNPFLQADGRIVTWFTRDSNLFEGEAWDDVVVVANVLTALALEDAENARRSFLAWGSARRGVERQGLNAAPYYAVPGNVEYAWRRAARLMNATLTIRTPRSGTSCLSMAFAVLLGARHPILRLVALQAADGTWPREPWCLAPGAKFGSRAITTAFVIEALSGGAVHGLADPY